MTANDNAAALDPVVTDLREIVSAMAKDERVPCDYFFRLDELVAELRHRLRAAGQIA